jgi:high-affinity iron transporter
MRLATETYRAALVPRLARLAHDVDALDRAVGDGRLAQARTLWLPAHLDYERLCAAYDTFGDLGDAIDGTPLGLPGGVHDPAFHGFLRLEYELWHEASHGQLVPVADELDADVHRLVARFPRLQTAPNDVSLRTHEILENTLQLEVTGEVDEGSHTTLATAWANVQGTQLALASVAQLLARDNPAVLASARSGLTRLETLLASYRRPGGSWRPLGDLTTAQRERLDADVSGLLERLALIPDRLQVTGRSTEDDRNRD